MKIIKQASSGISETKMQSFTYLNEKGCGFSFPVDSNGQVLLNNEYAQANYAMCLLGIDDKGKVIVNEGIVTYHHRYSECAIGQCACGAKVELHSFTNTCEKCGVDYNKSGQALAPREQWGEDTGEHYSDILRIK